MDGCIHCSRKPNKDGYGRISIKNKVYFEHRIAYQKEHPNDDISKKIIHHICENPSCVNPIHLVAVTKKEHSKEHGLSGITLEHSKKECCKYGHPFDKITNRQRSCSICLKRIKLKYANANKEKIKNYRKEWRNKNREMENERNKLYLHK